MPYLPSLTLPFRPGFAAFREISTREIKVEEPLIDHPCHRKLNWLAALRATDNVSPGDADVGDVNKVDPRELKEDALKEIWIREYSSSVVESTLALAEAWLQISANLLKSYPHSCLPHVIQCCRLWYFQNPSYSQRMEADRSSTVG